MIYNTANDWRDAPHKRIMLFGMSGLGKTFISNILRDTGSWYHYSVDYRIGTRYMGEHIVDNFKRHAMDNPFLADLLRSDSIAIISNIGFENLTPLSTYLGKPGDPNKGGLSFGEYQKRQAQHHAAEVSAMLDSSAFITRAHDIYGYDHFVCDTSGSVCEVVDGNNPNDPVLTALAPSLLPVWIKGDDDHIGELAQRFDRDPKPMFYCKDFLETAWKTYLTQHEVTADHVDPDHFVRWTYARALNHRQPRYEAIANNWGVTLAASDVARVKTAQDFQDLITDALT
ncbi:MAG: ATPase [Halocynthiibacter sp.]